MRRFFVAGFNDGGGPIAKNMGAPQSYNFKELNSVNNLNEFGNKFSPQSL